MNLFDYMLKTESLQGEIIMVIPDWTVWRKTGMPNGNEFFNRFSKRSWEERLISKKIWLRMLIRKV